VSRFTWDSTRVCLDFVYGPVTLYGETFQNLPLSIQISCYGPTTPYSNGAWFRLFRFRSPLLTESLRFLFLQVLRCFTSLSIALKPYVFRLQYPPIKEDGFSHSEISGSKCVCHSPKLIAAYHVLHRLLMPRHPPCALTCLTKNWSLLRYYQQFTILVKIDFLLP